MSRKIQYIIKGSEATDEEMAAVTKLRLDGNFVRVVAPNCPLWKGWEQVTLTLADDDILGDLDGDS